MGRRFLTVFLALFISLLGVSCGQKEPKEVVEDFYHAICEGDVEETKKYLTLRTQQAMEATMQLVGRKGLEDYIKEYSKQCKSYGGIKDIKVETRKVSDNKLEWNAVVVYKSGRRINDEGYLVKTDEGWKIDVKK